MIKNEELIEKYRRLIKGMEKEIDLKPAPKVIHLIGKVSILKMVIIDLQSGLCCPDPICKSKNIGHEKKYDYCIDCRRMFNGRH